MLSSHVMPLNYLEHFYKLNLEVRYKKVIKTALTETALAFIAAGLSCTYALSWPVILSYGTYTTSILAANFFARLINAYCKAKPPSDFLASRAVFFTDAFLSLSQSYLINSSVMLLVHEGGHALAASFLFIAPKIAVTVTGWQTGHTAVTYGHYSKIGALLGPLGCRLALSAGGSISAMTIGSVMLILADVIADKNLDLSSVLVSGALGTIGHHIHYALSAYHTERGQGHDFVILSEEGGIPPIVAAISLLAIPILIISGYRWAASYSLRKKRSKA